MKFHSALDAREARALLKWRYELGSVPGSPIWESRVSLELTSTSFGGDMVSRFIHYNSHRSGVSVDEGRRN